MKKFAYERTYYEGGYARSEPLVHSLTDKITLALPDNSKRDVIIRFLARKEDGCAEEYFVSLYENMTTASGGGRQRFNGPNVVDVYREDSVINVFDNVFKLPKPPRPGLTIRLNRQCYPVFGQLAVRKDYTDIKADVYVGAAPL